MCRRVAKRQWLRKTNQLRNTKHPMTNNQTHRVPILLQALLLLAFVASAGSALGKAGDLVIRLTSAPGFGAVEANAKFRDRGGVQVFSSTVNNALGLAGMVLTVSVDGKPLG